MTMSEIDTLLKHNETYRELKEKAIEKARAEMDSKSSKRNKKQKYTY